MFACSLFLFHRYLVWFGYNEYVQRLCRSHVGSLDGDYQQFSTGVFTSCQ